MNQQYNNLNKTTSEEAGLISLPLKGYGNIPEESTNRVETEERLTLPGQNSSVFSATCNTINSICGSGEVGIPNAFRLGGLGLSILLMLFSGVLSGYTMHLVVAASHLAGVSTLPDLVRVAFGKRFGALVLAMIMIFPMMGMTSYKVIAGDTVSALIRRAGGDALSNSILSNRQFVVILFTLLITLPLSLYKYIGHLAKWSLLSLALVIFIGVVLAVRAVTMGANIAHAEDPWTFAYMDMNFVKSINVMAFAYVCHQMVLQIYGSLKNPSMKKWNTVVGISVVSSFSIMLIYGVLGYVTFTTLTQGDILENLCYDDILANAARAALALHVVLVYPLETLVVREACENWLLSGAEQPPPLWRHVLVTVIIVAITVGVSLATNCLAIVQEFAGALGGTPLCYIIPAVAFIRLREEPTFCVKNVIPLFVIVFGLFASCAGVTLAIIEIVNGVKCKQASQMVYCQHPVNQTLQRMNQTLT